MKPTHVIIHHTVTPQEYAPDGINAGHKSRGFPKSSLGWYIGYHYLIGHNYVLQAREETECGAHAGAAWNCRAVGIALTGDYQNVNKEPLPFQMERLSNLLTTMTRRLGIPKENVILHRDTKSTACPGQYINHTFIRNLIKEEAMDANEALNAIKNACKEKFGRVYDPMIVVAQRADNTTEGIYVVRATNGMRMILKPLNFNTGNNPTDRVLKQYNSAYVERVGIRVDEKYIHPLPNGGEYLAPKD